MVCRRPAQFTTQIIVKCCGKGTRIPDYGFYHMLAYTGVLDLAHPGPFNVTMKLAQDIRVLVRRALVEDIGHGDLTTVAIGVAGRQATAIVWGKSDGVLYGSAIFEEVLRHLDKRVAIRWRIKDGQAYVAGTKLATVEGDAAALLSGERTALNFLARLSGVATLTRKFVEKVAGTRAGVLDTRKTTPGWRLLEKQAVKAGGGINHRMGLDDAIMIKNNHITACGGIENALKKVRQRRSRRKVPIICETRSIREVRLALAYGVDWILLDHFGPARLEKAVAEVRRFEKKHRCRIALEGSGGVNLRNVRARAQTGIDYLSVGALTQSAPAADISMQLLG